MESVGFKFPQGEWCEDSKTNAKLYIDFYPASLTLNGKSYNVGCFGHASKIFHIVTGEGLFDRLEKLKETA